MEGQSPSSTKEREPCKNLLLLLTRRLLRTELMLSWTTTRGGYGVHTITYPDGEVQHDERDEEYDEEVRQWHLANGFKEVVR